MESGDDKKMRAHMRVPLTYLYKAVEMAGARKSVIIILWFAKPRRDWPILWWRHLTLCLWLPVLSPFPRSPFRTLSIDIQFKLTALRRVLYDRYVMEMHAEGITVKISPNYKDIFA